MYSTIEGACGARCLGAALYSRAGQTRMTILQGAALFIAAILAGALNSVAGGGSFISFPTLLFTGVPSVQANATNTVALWPGSLASIPPYRKDLTHERRELILFSVVSVIGGVL